MTHGNDRPIRLASRVLFAIVVIAGVGAAVLAQESGVLGSFEIGDSGTPPVAGTADILAAGDLAGPDWSELFNADGTLRDEIDESGNAPGNGIPDYVDLHGGLAALFLSDDVSVGGTTDFTRRIAPGRLGTGVVPGEEDLGNAYVYLTAGPSGQTLLYAGIERISTRPAWLEIELSQSVVRPGHGFPDTNGWEIVGAPSVGDLRLRIEYGNGARLESIALDRWADAAADGQPGWHRLTVLDEEGCNLADPAAEPALEAETLCAFLNAGSIPGGVWPSYDASGATITDLGRRHFTELGLNVSVSTGREAGAPEYRSIRFSTASDLAFGHFDKGGAR